ncbi:hypothetical protein C8Q77DRAFT_304726 [Trametes polyzona]|nr:hypothetical protein C8Q77DRAFT_304726 [Trametes polyzona]
MPRAFHLQPLESTPEWLMESPITADDFRCTTPASTIFRMSFGARSHLHHRESVVMSESESEHEEDEDADNQSDASTFLWDDDSDTEEDAETIAEPEPLSAPKPKPDTDAERTTPPVVPLPPSHTRAPSAESSAPSTSSKPRRKVNMHLPWFMQVDPACLAALDDQLLQSPLDAFADLCYAQAVSGSAGASSGAHTQSQAQRYGYSWRRLSRLLSACPEMSQAAAALDLASVSAKAECEGASESGSGSDTDSEQLASPEQAAAPQGEAGWCGVYQPPADRQYAENPHRPYVSRIFAS